MEFTRKDFNETIDLAGLLKKIDNIDAHYVDKVSDEIFKYQPFFLSVLLGYSLDVTPVEMEEIMKIYFLIWEYFRGNKNVLTKKLTQAIYEKIQNRNIQILKNSETIKSKTARKKVYNDDLQNLNSKALLTAILFRFDTQPVLMEMEVQLKGIIMISTKSFIECFESI